MKFIKSGLEERETDDLGGSSTTEQFVEWPVVESHACRQRFVQRRRCRQIAQKTRLVGSIVLSKTSSSVLSDTSAISNLSFAYSSPGLTGNALPRLFHDCPIFFIVR